MKFLVDAQLPRRLVDRLRAAGHDAVHTKDLPNENRTIDREIIEQSLRDKSVVITKDQDFVDSMTLKGEPHKLLLISTGNISNNELENLFVPNIPAIEAAFQSNDFVELSRTALTVHW
jgi:predicted nuclease of predicted toxin-antitoxin system